jgi:dipeptidyl aminopeptidase/acylaminoacyl peptidase
MGMTVWAILAAVLGMVQSDEVAPPPEAPATPEILGEGVVSLPDRYEYCSSLSRDRRTLYIGIEHGDWQSLEAYDWDGEAWGNRRHVFGAPDYNAHDPYLSADEQRLYFITAHRGSADIAYLPKLEDGSWGDPEFLGREVNGPANDYYTSFTDDGTLYFSSNREGAQGYDIHVARPGEEPERLPSPVNTAAYEGDPYIDPEGRYLIFASTRRRGLGRGDLYLSLPDGEGGWSYPIAFDERVNTAGHELCPLVSLDGSAFLFTSKEEIRWVSTVIIEEMIAEHAP